MMATPTIDDLYKSLAAADAAGDTQAAQILADYIRTLEGVQTTPAAPSMTEQLGRQMGLATRPMAQAVMSAGGMLPLVVDPAVNFFNLAAGTNVPTMSQAMPRTLTAMGFPEPATATERVVQDMSTAGYGVAGAANLARQALPAVTSQTAQEFLKMLATNPQAQAAAATAATAAGGALREGGAGTAAQMGGAMLAGMVAPGGPKLPITQRAIAAPATMVQPFTQAGREVIVGNVLRKLATEPDLAASRLAQAEPLVPNVRPTTAATAFDPGLAGLETSLRSATFDPSNLFGARLSANQQALLDAFRKISGKPGSVAAAEKKRTEVTRPMREEAFAAVTVDPVTFQSGVNLVVNRAIDNVMASPVGVRMDVESAMKWATERVAKGKTPMSLYEVRKDLADAVQGKYNQENPSLRLAKGQLKDVIKAVDDVIDASAPGFRAYMDKYSKMSGPIDQMKMLQEIERKVTTGQPNLMTGEPVLAAGSLRRQLANKADELDLKLSIPAQTRLDNIIDEINRGMAATAPGVRAPGSDTFKNMSMGNLIGRVFSESMATNTTLRTMTRPLDFLYKLPDEQIQQLLVESMLDPKMAAMMMSKANMMKVEPLAKSLRQKAEQLGFGTTIGAAQGVDEMPPELRFPLD
jgi:hypothetical protein